MDINFNEMIKLKDDITNYLHLKRMDFENSKKELSDVSLFSDIEKFDRMKEIMSEMEQHSNMYTNAKNFLVRLNSISEGITLNSSADAIAKCVSEYLILRHTNEYGIVVDEMNKRFDNDNKMSL